MLSQYNKTNDLVKTDMFAGILVSNDLTKPSDCTIYTYHFSPYYIDDYAKTEPKPSIQFEQNFFFSFEVCYKGLAKNVFIALRFYG